MKIDDYFAPAMRRSQERAMKRRAAYLSEMAAAIPNQQSLLTEFGIAQHQQRVEQTTATIQQDYHEQVAAARVALGRTF